MQPTLARRGDALRPGKSRPRGTADGLRWSPIDALRWILCLPAGLLGAWLAYRALILLGRFSAFLDSAPADSFLFHLRENTFSYAAMGAAFVYLGAQVAPAHRRIVGSILGASGLLVSAVCVIAALSRHDYSAAWGGVCTGVGVAGVSYSIHAGRIGIDG